MWHVLDHVRVQMILAKDGYGYHNAYGLSAGATGLDDIYRSISTFLVYLFLILAYPLHRLIST